MICLGNEGRLIIDASLISTDQHVQLFFQIDTIDARNPAPVDIEKIPCFMCFHLIITRG